MYSSRVQLNSSNFDSLVFNSSTAWFVDFYVPWCGYCIRFSNLYERFLQSNPGWQPVVNFGAISCEYEPICRIYNLHHFPTLLYYSPMSSPSSPAKLMNYNLMQVPIMSIVLDTLTKERNPLPHWPYFRLVRYKELLKIMNQEGNQIAVVVVDGSESDMLSRVLMMDFVNYKSELPIFRVDHVNATALMSEFGESNWMVVPPCLLLVNTKTGSVRRLDDPSMSQRSGFLRSYYQRIIAHTLSNMGVRPIANKPAGYKIVDIPISRFKPIKRRYLRAVYMDDLESCLHYMLRVEVAKNTVIEREALRALKNMLNLIMECFPGRPELMEVLDRVREHVVYSDSFISGEDVRNLTLMGDGQLVLPEELNWKHCQGSQPHFRGYPCSLWTMFHVLTVGHALRSKSSTESRFTAADVISTMVEYIYNFFSCSLCRQHFRDGTIRHREELRYQPNAVLYLWNSHNRLNRRLAGDETEDPMVPKIQFPSIEQCPECYYDSGGSLSWNEEAVYAFLLRYYSDIVDH